MSLTQGSRLGAYEILGPVGSGGMGEVHRALPYFDWPPEQLEWPALLKQLDEPPKTES